MRILKNTARRTIALLLCFITAAGLSAGVVAADYTVTISTETMSVFVNDRDTLTVTVSGISDYTVAWSDTATGVEGETAAGLNLIANGSSCIVEGVSIGVSFVIATITPTDGVSPQKTVKCKVYVSERIPVTSVLLDKSAATLSVGKSLQLKANALPEIATTTGIMWNIDEGNYATLSVSESRSGEYITITALSPGIATITANASDGKGAKATFTLTVTAPPESIVLQETATAVVGNKTLKLDAQVTPTNAFNTKIVWESSHTDIATVDYSKGIINCLKVGKTTITAYVEGYLDENGKRVEASCDLTITVSAYPVTGLAFNNDKVTVIEKKSTPIVVKIDPINASNKKLWITCDDEAIISVPTSGTVTATATGSASFNVTGLKPGTTTVTVISDENRDIKATCTVEVLKTPTIPVTGVTLNPANATLVVGGTVTPKVTIAPTDATIKTVEWKSDNPNIAMVESTGKITATGPGTTIIRAIPLDDTNNVVAEFPVNVLCLADGTGKTLETLTIKQDDQVTFNVAHLPQNSGLTVSWTTSKTSVATISETTGQSTKVTGQGSGEAVITATVKRGTTVIATLKCTVSVVGIVSDINYRIVGTEIVNFNVSDFTSVCTSVTGTALSYVKFKLPKADDGALYYMYEKTNEAPVSDKTLYYASSAPKISDISFVPVSNFIDSTRIEYTAADTKGKTFTGYINITVGDSTGDIKYSTGMDTPVTFSAEDFNEFCKKTTGYTLNSVKFTLPKSTEGVLYYMYELDNTQKIKGTKITSTTNYYNSSDPKISDITFLPATGFIGSVDIKFTGRDSKTGAVSGTVRITVGRGTSSGADIEYIIKKNEVLFFKLEDFNDYCMIATGENLNYIQLTPPASSRGVLYYSPSSTGSTIGTVTSSGRYYRGSNPFLQSVHFVPYQDYEGMFTMKFTGVNTAGTEFSGTIGIIVGDSYGDVRYSAGVNVPIHFSNTEFNDFCKAELGANFDYIQFTLPKPTEGVLYHQYGRSGETLVTTDKMYRRTAYPRLDEVTFIPAEGFTGVVEFAFTGRSVAGKNLSGTVALTYDPSLTGTPIIYYTTEYAPVNLNSTDFVEACSKRGAESLVSVKFVLPPESVGSLYEGYRDHNSRGELVDGKTVYTTSGTRPISGVTFVPKAGVTGSVSIAYEGTDTKGVKFTGYVHILIPSVVASSFNDMDKHTWAAASVEYLRDTGVVEGTGGNNYRPGDSIRRGDFMLMIYRAFGLSSTGTASFRDVPSSSHYANAIAAGKMMGIALGEPDGRFRPEDSITRQDAMVMIHRTLSRLDREVPDSAGSKLSGFPDGRSVYDYAKDAVSDLVSAGVVYGDDRGRLNPTNPVTRAEMALILHRVLTLRV